MNIEECKKCPNNVRFENGQVFCNFHSNIESITTAHNPSTGVGVVFGCPKEKES
jgi:hypothetical protein